MTRDPMQMRTDYEKQLAEQGRELKQTQARLARVQAYADVMERSASNPGGAGSVKSSRQALRTLFNAMVQPEQRLQDGDLLEIEA